MINLDGRILDQLNESQMWLLIHVVKRINADGECWPSTRTIQQDTKWSDVKKVRRVRDELVQMGILQAYERTREDGGQTSNLYRINTDYIGVYVSAKKLQNFTRGEGKNLTRGVGKNNTQGEGIKNTPPNEVLTKEVLTKEEHTHNAPAKIEKTFVETANEMSEAIKTDTGLQEQFIAMAKAAGYTGKADRIFMLWASKVSPYERKEWRKYFPRLMSYMAVEARADYRAKPKTYTSPGDQPAPTPTYYKTKPRPRHEWTPADIEQFRKTFEG